ncbi:hypothetical protein NPIL_159981 [Nephila pilipes]|uniref:Uncharacterized protein n=1 Tax=Nephila pilipes TaxID=299642 RepID=A0A8X6TLH0_NEPPI|nr:hypothetical protein NPIL_159981 [Nephila pilipes]
MTEQFPIFSCLTSAFSEMHRSTSMTASGPVRTFWSLHIAWRKKRKEQKNTPTNLSQEIRNSNWTNAPNVTWEETDGHSYIPNLFYFF